MNQLPLFYDQEDPVGLQNFVIYRSSAGSGKTHTLVKEFLSLILKNPHDYEHILAITFTNKAAGEMKERVLDELMAIAADQNTIIREDIQREFTEQNIHADLVSRARKALEAILYDYGNLSIGTLDHFFTRMVRSLARELNLPLRYDIDVDNQKAIDYSIDKLYDKIDQEERLQNWLAEFSFSRMDNDKGWRIDQNLQELGNALFNENFHIGLGDKSTSMDEFQQLVDDLQEDVSMFKKSMKDRARKALDLIEKHGLQTNDFIGGTASNFSNILDDKYDFGVRFQKLIDGEGSWYAKKSIKKEEIDKLASEELDKLVFEIGEIKSKFYQKYISAKELLKNIFSYGIMEVLGENLQDYRTENNLVLLADNTFLLRDVIEEKDAPFLYERIGSRYKHIMVDEFQDTSVYQWKNLLPLIKNAVSSWYRVLVVGDVKQSIYRWRGGNMNLLLKGVQKDMQVFSEQVKEEKLNFNYRSTTEVVAFNNNFFRVAVEKMLQTKNLPEDSSLISKAYQDVKQEARSPKKVGLTGYVEAEFFITDESGHWKEKIKDKLLKDIKEALDDGYTYRDVFVLTDTNDLGNETAVFLLENHIPVITSEAMQVQQSRVVHLLISALQWINEPNNALYRTNFLKIYTEIHQSGVSDRDILLKENKEIFEQIIPSELIKKKAVIKMLPLYELVENLIISLDIQKKSNRFLLKFLDVCVEQSIWGRNDVFSFLNWWEDSKDDIKIVLPEGEDAVEIMTVHKAKGLQRPIVMLPYANYGLKPRADSVFWSAKLPDYYQEFKLLPFNFVNALLDSDFKAAYQKELLEGMLERLNVVYVAFTRAEDRLYIYSKDVEDVKDVTDLNKLLKSVLSDPELSIGNMEEELGRYNYGEKSASPGKKSQGQEDISFLSEIHSYYPESRARIRFDSKSFWQVSETETSRAVQEGLKIHQILSEIGTKNDISSAISNALNLGIISNDEKDEITSQIESIVNDDEIGLWFSEKWTVLNEQEIQFEGKKYRPDRIMIKDDEAVVIDFKTGSPLAEHENQVRTYGRLMELSGFKSRKYLLYINEGKFEKVEVE